MSLRLAVDIGGTFTDLVLMDSVSGSTAIAKTLTTPGNPAEGVERGLLQVLKEAHPGAAEPEAVAVCLLHSYRNPAHERRLAEVVASVAPQMIVSLSSDVVPTLREYERAVTTVANVYVRPITDRYLADLERRLGERGFTGSLLIVLSAGNVCTPETARLLPIRAVESGPAAGALAAVTYGEGARLEHLLSFTRW